MYFMADFTVGTMADLIGFKGYVYFWRKSRDVLNSLQASKRVDSV